MVEYSTSQGGCTCPLADLLTESQALGAVDAEGGGGVDGDPPAGGRGLVLLEDQFPLCIDLKKPLGGSSRDKTRNFSS